MSSNDIKWYEIRYFLILMLIISVSSLATILILPSEIKNIPQITIPLLIISGVIGLVSVLTIAVTIIAAIGLSSSDKAFGLPEGSIRAVIALSLILIFSFISIHLYQNLRKPSTAKAILTLEQLGQIPANDLVASKPMDNGSGLFEVQRVYHNRVGNDFVKQLFTTISTLVVAVAGFYFGSKTLSSARSALADERAEAKVDVEAKAKAKVGAKTKPKAKIQADANVENNDVAEATKKIDGAAAAAERVDAKQAQKVPMPKLFDIQPRHENEADKTLPVEIFGENIALPPKAVKLVLESNEAIEIPVSNVKFTKGKMEEKIGVKELQGNINIPQSQEEGTYALVVTDADGYDVQLENAFHFEKL